MLYMRLWRLWAYKYRFLGVTPQRLTFRRKLSPSFSCFCWFLAWLTLRTPSWKYIPPKRQAFSELHGVTTQKTVPFRDQVLHRCFDGIYCLHLQVKTTYKAKEYNNPEYNDLNTQRGWCILNGVYTQQQNVYCDFSLAIWSGHRHGP
jgi:hypothetical protein